MKNRIKQIRNTLNLTQTEFAKQAGISRSIVAAYEGGIIVKRKGVFARFIHLGSDAYLFNGFGSDGVAVYRGASVNRVILAQRYVEHFGVIFAQTRFYLHIDVVLLALLQREGSAEEPVVVALVERRIVNMLRFIGIIRPTPAVAVHAFRCP